MNNANNAAAKAAASKKKMMLAAVLVAFLCCVCCCISSVVSGGGLFFASKKKDDPSNTPSPSPSPTASSHSEIFSIDSEVTMYEQCNSNSKIIAAAATNIGHLSSEVTLERNFINNPENEKVRRIEVKNVEILPGSKWTVVSNNNQGVKGETTVILDLPQGYTGNQTQVLDIGSECSDNAESYIKDINLIYKPIKLDVKEKNEVEGYRI